MDATKLTRNMSCSVTPETYLDVLKLASKRGVSVSEILRHFIEDGLNTTAPAELRQLSDRLSTIEQALLEVYEMAVMNWAPIKNQKRWLRYHGCQGILKSGRRNSKNEEKPKR